MKQFKELNCIDNFMFNELIMQEDTEKAKKFCKIIIERVLGIKIRILDITPQRVVQGIKPDMHGIQMDAWIKAVEEDETADISLKINPVFYDIEPNTYKVSSEPQRLRFYHSVIDTKIFSAGRHYDELPRVILIMISDYDLFGKNRMVYTFQRKCIEDPALEYDDGQKTIVLYTDGEFEQDDEYSRKLSDMLHFIVDSSDKNAIDSELSDIHEMMKRIKDNSVIGDFYMHSYDAYLHFREEGREEGLRDGRAEGRAEGLAAGRAEGREEGLAAGREEGLAAGREEGLAEGREEGLAEGREEGRAEGREEGLAEGREEGRVEGREEGLAEGRTEDILELLGEIGDVSDSLRERICSEKDNNTLMTWLKLAAKSKTIKEFEEAM